VVSPHAAARDYRWDLGGSGTYVLDTGAQPRAVTRFTRAGEHRIAVRIIGGTAVLSGALELRIAPAVAAHRHRTAPRRRGARAAGDPGVTIVDFSFSPGSTTVHAGDTVKWSNHGPSAHTATAEDGSFNTGVLQNGATASHIFTQPGTFTYFCQIHPFMHGTIVVLAAATSRPAQSRPSTPRVSSPRVDTARHPPTVAAPRAAGPTLPVTGANLATEVLAGLLLVGGGALLRRARRQRG
jgi:LPXTG-motif cell wall-anchored protein